MSRMVVIYAQPPDPAVFDDHYFRIHVPLAKQLPGLRSYEVSRGAITTRDGVGPYLVATLQFDSMQALKAAFASEPGQACAADVRSFASIAGASTMLLFEVQTV